MDGFQEMHFNKKLRKRKYPENWEDSTSSLSFFVILDISMIKLESVYEHTKLHALMNSS